MLLQKAKFHSLTKSITKSVIYNPNEYAQWVLFSGKGMEKHVCGLCIFKIPFILHGPNTLNIICPVFFLSFPFCFFLLSFPLFACLDLTSITEWLSSILYLHRTPTEILTLWRRWCWIFQSHFTGTNIESQQDWISCNNSHISLTAKSGPTPKDFWFSIQHSFQYQQKIVLEPITTWFIKSNHRGKTELEAITNS